MPSLQPKPKQKCHKRCPLVLVDHFFGLVWNVAHLWLEELGTPDAEVNVDI
jgi:hypothetical protein